MQPSTPVPSETQKKLSSAKWCLSVGCCTVFVGLMNSLHEQLVSWGQRFLTLVWSHSLDISQWSLISCNCKPVWSEAHALSCLKLQRGIFVCFPSKEFSFLFFLLLMWKLFACKTIHMHWKWSGHKNKEREREGSLVIWILWHYRWALQ